MLLFLAIAVVLLLGVGIGFAWGFFVGKEKGAAEEAAKWKEKGEWTKVKGEKYE